MSPKPLRRASWQQFYGQRRFGILLLILLVLLVGPQTLTSLGLSVAWFDALMSILMLAAILSLCFERQQRAYALLLGIPSLLFSVAGHSLSGRLGVQVLALGLFLFGSAILIIKSLFSSGIVVTAGRGATFANGQFVGGQAWSAVNGSYTRWGAFGTGYYGRYPGAWFPGRWALATTAWATAGWATAGDYCGCEEEGAYYDYGENVTYEDGNVYYGEEAVASSEQYYEQANELAGAGQEAANEDWLPLGVFAIVTEPTQTQTDRVVQLALNEEGAIQGNFHDFLTDKVTPVTGSVDRKTQRVALKLEGNDELIVETGLYNLTNDEVPVLVHFNAERQEARTFIRLEKPADEK